METQLFQGISQVIYSKVATVGCLTFLTFLPLTISELLLFSHKPRHHSSTLAPREMAVVFLESSLQDRSIGTPWTYVGVSVRK